MSTPVVRTVRYVVARWVEDVAHRVDLGDDTKAKYTRFARAMVAWGGRRAFDGLDLTDFVIVLREAGISPRTLVLDASMARSIHRWAMATGLVPTTARMRIPRLRVDKELFVLNHRTPAPSEVARVLAVMPRDDWRVALLVIARTGARVGEVVSLRSMDFDGAGGRLALGAVEGARKTGMRWFPLDAATVADLSGRGGRGTEPLFDFGGLTAPRQGLRNRLTPACDLAGVPRFTPHGLRRMVVSRLLRAKVDPGTAATLTGHTVEVMMAHYQVVSEDDRRMAAETANLGDLVDPVRRSAA